MKHLFYKSDDQETGYKRKTKTGPNSPTLPYSTAAVMEKGQENEQEDEQEDDQERIDCFL